MPKHTLTIATILSLLFLGGLFIFNRQQQGAEIEQTHAELDTIKADLVEEDNALKNLQLEVETQKKTIAQLEEEKAGATKAQESIEAEMRKALQTRDVTISELQGKLTVNILDRVLFDSGEAVLKPEGESVLLQLAKVLAQFPNRQIQVVGHTDNVPIRVGSFNRYLDNWELSVGRALAAVKFLAEKAGVDPRRLGAVGYGEYHPIASNNTPEGKARNRRITVLVLPEEFAGIENPPTISTNSVVPAPQ